MRIAVHDLRPPFRWNLANQLKENRVILFVAQIGRLFVSVNFFPDDIRLDRVPQL